MSQATVIPRRSGIDLLNFLFDFSASSDACLLDLRNSSGLKFVQSPMFCFQMFETYREAILFIFLEGGGEHACAVNGLAQGTTSDDHARSQSASLQ